MELQTDRMIAEKENGIGWMTFNNPERRNAISVEMRLAAIDILDAFEEDNEIRVIVMKGAGDKAFVSGADISQFEKNRATEEARRATAEISDRMQERFDTLRKPLVAMIHGYCLGGGLRVAMNADIRIASDDAQFGVPAARLGISYPLEAIKRLVELVGPSCAKEILFTARRLDAAEALQFGLINRVVPRADLETEVCRLAASIAESAPLTIKASKAIISEVLKAPNERDEALCERLGEECMLSADHVEGRRAFMEKRKPVFTGR